MAILESHNGYYLWNYLPSQPAAGIFAVLFIFATAAHSWKFYSTGAKFCTVFVIGCVCKFPPLSRSPLSNGHISGTKAKLRNSRSNRLHCPRHSLQPNRKPDAIHHSKPLHPCRSSPVRSKYLYDFGTHNPCCECATFVID